MTRQRPDQGTFVRHRLQIATEPLVMPGEGDADGSVYTFELTGEAILVAADVQAMRITARGDRRLRFAVNEKVGLRINRDHLFLFDAGTEQRLRR